MKERIIVKYHYQNDAHDKTANCFSMVRDSEKPLKIIDVLGEFPGLRVREYGTKGYHFRFLDKLGKLNCWVDIKNMNVQAPIIKNVIEVKVLLLPKQADSLIFSSLEADVARYEEKQSQQKEKMNGSMSNPSPAGMPNNYRTQPLTQQMPGNESKPKTPVIGTPVQPVSTGTKTAKAFNLEETDILGGLDLGGSTLTAKTPTLLEQDLGDFGVSPTSKTNEKNGDDLLGDLQINVEDLGSKASGLDDLKMQELFGEIDPNAKSLAAESKLREMQAEQVAAAKIAERKRIADENQRQIDAKLSVGEVLEPKIKAWAFASNGVPNNIRILLSTLHMIVWQECEWEAITMGELMTDAQVRSQYRKAITKVHPDHNSHITDAGALFLMDRLFNLLNKAYTEFSSKK